MCVCRNSAMPGSGWKKFERSIMKLLFTSNTNDVAFLKTMLDEAGIESEITNDSLPYAGAAFFPRLWIANDNDFARASEIRDRFRAPQTAASGPWVCPVCGETLEGQFSSCWKCDSTRKQPA